MTRSKLFLSLLNMLLALAAGIAAFLGATGPARAALSDCIDATCRITADDGSRGSGCVFEDHARIGVRVDRRPRRGQQPDSAM